MLLWREPVPASWLPKMLAHLPAVLVDHCHLERKATTTVLSLMKYRALQHHTAHLAAIAREELDHFDLLLALLKRRGIPFGQPHSSPWISGMMDAIRRGQQKQVIDHLICCSLIEGRSCEKFQMLGEALAGIDDEVAGMYRGLVQSEGNHYADFWLMACELDDAEAHRRLNDFLELDAQLIRRTHDLPLLH
ncbi:MAG: tRNA-(ms[2]io[6]A)-hydroxylase [Pedosphaera sp.]|nr:tRNA-(ms[2]io[6]A)-hydroxylase [Pedosphaera sp.]MSU42722.1 tRNA-(ms[2]io[6]A)-hydroxylase [Pedosphaera sp.]